MHFDVFFPSVSKCHVSLLRFYIVLICRCSIPPIINVFKLRWRLHNHICTYKKYLPLSGQWNIVWCVLSTWGIVAFAIVNVPVSFATILMNIFFATVWLFSERTSKQHKSCCLMFYCGHLLDAILFITF